MFFSPPNVLSLFSFFNTIPPIIFICPSVIPECAQTSIIAVQFDGGVILGADSRTSTGSYVANRVSDKLTEIGDRIYCCRSGSAADTQAVSDIVRYNLSSLNVQLGENTMPRVKTCATLFKKMCYDYKAQLMAGIIVAGWDPVQGGQVYSIPLGGSMVRQPYAIGGSGSTYIYAYCDSAYKTGMTKDECRAFVKNALSLAMARDGSSGGVIRTVAITKDGVDRDFTPGNDLPYMTEKQFGNEMV
jgi:20S proteasome subunit beta 1